MKVSEAFILKFVEDTFPSKDISSPAWYATIYYYLTDRRYGTIRKLDEFLKDQLVQPHKDLVAVAKTLRESAKSPDDLIIKVLRYVANRVQYVSDSVNFGSSEVWVSAYEVWRSKKDDCDGMNSLIYVLARLAGISDLILWSSIGSVAEGGHYWINYFSTETDKWYVVDSTYYADFTMIPYRKEFKFSSDRYVEAWCVFNEQYMLRQKKE